jgi:drug/metabolite transporter (DMT)-like permease
LSLHVHASSSSPPPAATNNNGQPPIKKQHSLPYYAASIGAVIILGAANRVLYKISLIPLGTPAGIFFLAQFQTFGYVAVYFWVLSIRRRTGSVSTEMMNIPNRHMSRFLSIGFVEAAGSLMGFYAAAQLPGILLPILAQTAILWQVVLAKVVLKKKLGWSQLIGVALVGMGVVAAAWPSSGKLSASILSGVDPKYVWLFILSMLFPAFDTVLKEQLFASSRRDLGGENVDLFVVNSFGSLSQGLFILAAFPMLTSMAGLSIQQLPGYLYQGWQAFTGTLPGIAAQGAPLLPLSYILMNLLFNVAALNLVRSAGNVTMCLTMSAIVPITLFAFTLPLPHLPPPPVLGSTFILGVMVMVLGLLFYNSSLLAPQIRASLKKWATA